MDAEWIEKWVGRLHEVCERMRRAVNEEGNRGPTPAYREVVAELLTKARRLAPPPERVVESVCRCCGRPWSEESEHATHEG